MESRARLAGPEQFVLKAVKANWFVMVLCGYGGDREAGIGREGDLLHSGY